jgi:hypothetical protein
MRVGARHEKAADPGLGHGCAQKWYSRRRGLGGGAAGKILEHLRSSEMWRAVN